MWRCHAINIVIIARKARCGITRLTCVLRSARQWGVCSLARPIGYKPTAEQRAAISLGLRLYYARCASGELPPAKKGRSPKFQPPAEFAELYHTFYKTYGSKEARRLIQDHAAVVARRQKANHETQISKEKIA